MKAQRKITLPLVTLYTSSGLCRLATKSTTSKSTAEDYASFRLHYIPAVACRSPVKSTEVKVQRYFPAFIFCRTPRCKLSQISLPLPLHFSHLPHPTPDVGACSPCGVLVDDFTACFVVELRVEHRPQRAPAFPCGRSH